MFNSIIRRRTDTDLTTTQHIVTYLDRLWSGGPLDVHLDHEVAALVVALAADCSRSTDEDIEPNHTGRDNYYTKAQTKFRDS